VQASDENDIIFLQNETETIIAYPNAVVLVGAFQLLEVPDIFECAGLFDLCDSFLDVLP
jgi:hypothetical protein